MSIVCFHLLAQELKEEKGQQMFFHFYRTDISAKSACWTDVTLSSKVSWCHQMGRSFGGKNSKHRRLLQIIQLGYLEQYQSHKEVSGNSRNQIRLVWTQWKRNFSPLNGFIMHQDTSEAKETVWQNYINFHEPSSPRKSWKLKHNESLEGKNLPSSSLLENLNADSIKGESLRNHSRNKN